MGVDFRTFSKYLFVQYRYFGLKYRFCEENVQKIGPVAFELALSPYRPRNDNIRIYRQTFVNHFVDHNHTILSLYSSTVEYTIK